MTRNFSGKYLSGIVIGIVVLLFFLSGKSFSQTTFYHRYIIEFKDKNNSPYSLSNPSAYLSQRAIERRNRYGIPITETDLPINPSYIQAVEATGVKLLNRSKWLNSISIQTDDSLALIAIRELPFVKSAAPIALKQSPSSSNHENISDEENAERYDYGTAFHQINMLEGDALHDNGFRGNGMIIAVLDGGFINVPVLDVFDSLFNDQRILGVWNFVKGTDSVFDYSYHGTEVLSFIEANKPGTMIGTAPKASIYLFVTEDAASEYPIEEHNWAAAAEVADSLGADVISSSLGYSEFSDPSFNYTYADMDGKTAISSRAATMAARKGMIVCSSAGNSGQQPWHYITAPADADSILTTGATDSLGIRTLFSSYGPTSDGRIKPNVVALGIRAWAIDPLPEDSTTFPGNGTSFSNPILAGLVACLWQAHPDKNNQQVINAIQQSASLYFHPNDSMGYGIPNFQVADLILSGKTPDDLQLTHAVLYPNPFTDVFGILYYSSSVEWQHVTIEIYDILGRSIVSIPATIQTGYNYLPIDYLKNSSGGDYFIRINFPDHTEILRARKG